jgi:hypothetical protein
MAKKGFGDEEKWQRQRASQKFGADLSDAALAGRSKRSGDADLPFREPLSDRRARMDSVRGSHKPGPRLLSTRTFYRSQGAL